MIELDSHAPNQAPALAQRDNLFNSLYRDTSLTNGHIAGRRIVRPLAVGSLLEAPSAEPLSDGILVGLTALTLPVVVYSFAQLWSLLAGGSLTQAIRAFLP